MLQLSLMSMIKSTTVWTPQKECSLLAWDGLASINAASHHYLTRYFKTNFETQDYNVLSFGTIDINFDHNFVPSRKISVADGNGILEKKYLELFASYFNTLILHVQSFRSKKRI